MCTGGRTASSSSSQETEHTKMNALCILHGVHVPLKVTVLGNEAELEKGKVKTTMVQLTSADMRTVKEDLGIKDYKQTLDELSVPEKCLIMALTSEPLPEKSKQREQISTDYYYTVNFTNAAVLDIVAWAPLMRYSSTELIPAVLVFAGKEMLPPGKGHVYAFIRPLKTVSETFFADSKLSKTHSVQGWSKLYKVPLSDIFRWEDINAGRRMAATELQFDNIELREYTIRGEKQRHYEFVYKQSSSQSEVLGKLKKVKYPSLDDDSQELEKKPDGAPNSGNAGERSNMVQKDKFDKKTMEKMHESFKSLDGETGKSGLPKRVSADSDPLRDNSQNSKSDNDDLGVIPGGSVAKAHKQFSRQGSTEPEKSFSGVVRSDSTVREKSGKTAVFGKCFASVEKFEKVFIKELQKGDMVVASHKWRDDNIGEVGLICTLPAISTKQIFVGVSFEEKLDIDTIEVRHVWENEDDCHEHCKGGKYVFIPVEFLLSSDGPHKSLRLLKEFTKTAEPRKTNESTMSSEIQVDFHYEATRRDFVNAPLEYSHEIARKLPNMGIEGNANSCYIDAVLFALFGFTANFDEGLIKQLPIGRRKDDVKMKIAAARNLLKYDIVTQLRSAQKVSWANVFKLRRALADILEDKSYLGNFMDAENFIVSLFSTVLQVPEFFEISEDNKDYVLQLFPPVTEDNKLSHPSVQYLLEEYCGWADIKLHAIPQTGFIIKLPVSDGVPEFKMVYPNINLQLENILSNKDGNATFMTLRSVICLKKNHFTCFVRTPGESRGKVTWIYHDSMPTERDQSIMTELEDLETALELAAARFHNPPKNVDLKSFSKECTSFLMFMLSSAYICVYEPVGRVSRSTRL